MVGDLVISKILALANAFDEGLVKSNDLSRQNYDIPIALWEAIDLRKSVPDRLYALLVGRSEEV